MIRIVLEENMIELKEISKLFLSPEGVKQYFPFCFTYSDHSSTIVDILIKVFVHNVDEAESLRYRKAYILALVENFICFHNDTPYIFIVDNFLWKPYHPSFYIQFEDIITFHHQCITRWLDRRYVRCNALAYRSVDEIKILSKKSIETLLSYFTKDRFSYMVYKSFNKIQFDKQSEPFIGISSVDDGNVTHLSFDTIANKVIERTPEHYLSCQFKLDIPKDHISSFQSITQEFESIIYKYLVPESQTEHKIYAFFRKCIGSFLVEKSNVKVKNVRIVCNKNSIGWEILSYMFDVLQTDLDIDVGDTLIPSHIEIDATRFSILTVKYDEDESRVLFQERCKHMKTSCILWMLSCAHLYQKDRKLPPFDHLQQIETKENKTKGNVSHDDEEMKIPEFITLFAQECLLVDMKKFITAADLYFIFLRWFEKSDFHGKMNVVKLRGFSKYLKCILDQNVFVKRSNHGFRLAVRMSDELKLDVEREKVKQMRENNDESDKEEEHEETEKEDIYESETPKDELPSKNKTEYTLYSYLKQFFPSIQRQFTIDQCKRKRYLPFDFCIPNLRIIIELDGSQHFRQVMNWKPPHEQFETDVFKQNIANESGYSVIRLLQEDVFQSKYDWKKEIIKHINILSESNEITNVFMCKNNEYEKIKSSLKTKVKCI